MQSVLTLRIVVVLITLLLAGCSHRNVELHILTSGDTSGWITPCGCTSNQSGGLERRATLIQSIGD
jgi:2',3'-cyclic-nucleotide 2'-phosphodiesterase (5'-nucleotidase family)